MSIGQLRGYYNKDVPTELTNQVKLVNQFNAKYHGERTSISSQN
jgi:hypothetical protein